MVSRKNLQTFGSLLILGALSVLVFTFWPVVREETKYNANQIFNIKYTVSPKAGSGEKKLTPPNTDFSIVIPKIGAAAPIVDNVDPIDPKNYLPALMKGVAHAKGTAYPGNFGNTYLFAHSTDAFYNVGRYNAVFYLIGKLEKGNEIDIYYKGKLIKNSVVDKKVVETGAGLPAGRQGSFTGLRVGVSVANTFGWVLGVPVNGRNLPKGETVDIKYS